jgi:hypothetical protein
MHIFVQRPAALAQSDSRRSARRSQTTQPNTDNRRLSRADGGSHDLSRMPTRAAHGASSEGTGSAGELDSVDAQRLAAAVTETAGRPIDAPTRAYFGARFGHDFTQIRIHDDATAARSTEALDARAYTLGNHIAFGPGEYAPQTGRGRALLAHELAHTLQQRHVHVGPAMIPSVGESHNTAECEADAAATLALSARSVPPRTPRIPTLGSGIGARIQRAVKTWAGVFDTAQYEEKREIGDGGFANLGVDITIVFTPGAAVNAEKIAFVQSVSRTIDGVPEPQREPHFANKSEDKDLKKKEAERDERERKTAEERSLQDYDTPPGGHIDAGLSHRTPLTGMLDPKKGENKLSQSPEATGSARLTEFGWRCKTCKPPTKDATLTDPTRLPVKLSSSVDASFETTALAVQGAQEGTYYGSVTWGWTKAAGENQPHKKPFQPGGRQPSKPIDKSGDFESKSSAPSSEFADIAHLWNQSTSSIGEKSIPLPEFEDKFIKTKKTELLEKPEKGKKIGELDVNTQVGAIQSSEGEAAALQKVIVVSGKFAGRVGFVKKDALADRETDPTPKRKPR